MKRIFFLYSLITLMVPLITVCQQSQSAYYDAKFIAEKCFDGSVFIHREDLYAVLKKYYPNTVLSESILRQNPFLKDFVPAAIALSEGKVTFEDVFSSVGNLDVSTIVDGFAKFLVARTKQELNVAFFEKFKNKIHETGYEDAFILFPQTCVTLDAIGDQIYNYEAYIGALRESFEADVNGLLSNLPKAINDGRYNSYFSAHPILKSTCLSATYIGNGLLNKVHPGQILSDFDVSNLDGFATPHPPAAPSHNDIKAAVQTLQLFSESLRSKGTDHYWIDKDSLNILLNDPIALQIYFGLIYQKALSIGITFSTGTLQSILSDNLLPISKISNANNYLNGFITQTTALAQTIRNLSGKDRDKLNFSDYYDFYTSALNLIEYATKINTLPGLTSLTLGPDFDRFLQIAKAGGNVALAINRKNYSSVIINTYQIYNFAFTAAPGDTTNRNFKTFLLRYGSFVASVAQAQNSDDVKKAIEATVLPSGSSRIKRETPFNVSLNAYTGLFIGREKITHVASNPFLNSYGVTAPIGVAISRGHSLFFLGTGNKGWRESKYGWSSSLFISLIDLGAVTAYRFKDDKTEQVPTIQLKQIFSPGAFISTGIPRTPLSFNLGAQMGPALRKIIVDKNTPGTDVSNNTYWRLSASLCVDIPLLNFYTRSK